MKGYSEYNQTECDVDRDRLRTTKRLGEYRAGLSTTMETVMCKGIV